MNPVVTVAVGFATAVAIFAAACLVSLMNPVEVFAEGLGTVGLVVGSVTTVGAFWALLGYLFDDEHLKERVP